VRTALQDQAAHTGFYGAWQLVRDRVLRLIEMCTGGDPSWKVYVTGHSQGGAVATFCAYELGRNQCAPPGPSHGGLERALEWVAKDMGTSGVHSAKLHTTGYLVQHTPHQVCSEAPIDNVHVLTKR
jgi:Lipase (class 3)